MFTRFVTAQCAPGSSSRSVRHGQYREPASEALADVFEVRGLWSPSARAVRPSAASEPTEVPFTKDMRPVRRQAFAGAGVARVGLSLRHSVVQTEHLSPGKQPKRKHNAGMASVSATSPRVGNIVVTGQRHRPLSGSEPKTLPNPSVEATNCSKLQFAPHLER